MADLRLPVIECFGPTIQGEGLMTGTVTNFLRTGGCGYNCKWCDSLYAVTPSEVLKNRTLMETHEVLDALDALPWAPYLTLTGGDPCIHENLGFLVQNLNVKGIKVAVETQGQFFPDWLELVDTVTFSPKGPSSGNMTPPHHIFEWLKSTQQTYKGQVCIKIVVFDPLKEFDSERAPLSPPRCDMEYAMDVYNLLPSQWYDAFYFTAGTPPWREPDGGGTTTAIMDRDRVIEVLKNQFELSEALLYQAKRGLNFNFKTHVGCQQHVLLWPDKEKGV